MFNQITNLSGGEIYLISSLIMFMLFFILVGVYLFRLSKKHIDEMSNLPLQGNKTNPYEED
ncbi:hypothetical protein OQZ33_23065 [Pedobacter sp. MC2016-05]|uniref:hypothetical protein n=1 Tax=Pedobacter sp. MC2016-05 TaxID=2994474 RepID=UPI0022468532|nr:hypothetical protein [Pedobacter sp. MC2016-05]MCX2477233.1 hypothetical protein [Pedobacter sp. MC2016-05]